MKIHPAVLAFASLLASVGTSQAQWDDDFQANPLDLFKPTPGLLQKENDGSAIASFCQNFFPNTTTASVDDLALELGRLDAATPLVRANATSEDSGIIILDSQGYYAVGWADPPYLINTNILPGWRVPPQNVDKPRKTLCYTDDPTNYNVGDDEIQKFRVTASSHKFGDVDTVEKQDQICELAFGVGVKSAAGAKFVPQLSLIAYLRSIGIGLNVPGPWDASCGHTASRGVSYNQDYGFQTSCYNGYRTQARLLCYSGDPDNYPHPMDVTWTAETMSDPKAVIPQVTQEPDLVVIEVQDEPKQASSHGDPHFKTFGGAKFDFHGGCDLVLFDNKIFANGLGMTVHIRTKINTWWSYIESAVLRIGDSTLELMGGADGAKYWINGELQKEQQDGTTFFLSNFPVTLRVINGKKLKFRVDLGSGDAISLENFKDFVGVNVRATSDRFEGSVGMMGSFPSGHMFARDGKTILEDADAFGQEWQVLASEPMMFHSTGGSVQPPEMCAMPDKTTKNRRRLGEALITVEDASIACTHAKEDEHDACIFDVLATNDKDMAGAY